ncbi:MAG: ABC transporter ATP-binding protein/permease [Bacilli bacterium]|nr:ABC transporter ATP-binding protein/permease [Bacilli bacterium]MDD4076707.1 ABC transporter ATP-binding protein [Bacilli bacterium]MDD4388300.1 ABC transporter ATP-binding protein [Bacilli bacterium]
MPSKNIIFKTLGKKTQTLLLLFFAIVLGVMSKVFSALIIRNIIDWVLPTVETDKLLFWVGLFAVVTLFSFLIDIFIKNRSLVIGTEISNSLAKAVYSSAIRAEINELNKIETEDLVKRIGEDCATIGNQYIGNNWLTFIQSLIFLIVIFISMMVLDPALGLLTYVTLPLVYMIVKTTDKYIDKVNQRAEKQYLKRSGEIRENFEKIRSIKLKNGVLHEENEFEIKSENFFKQYRNIQNLSEMINFKFYDLFVGFALAVILGLGGYLAMSDSLTTGTIVAFVILTPYAYTTFKKILDVRISINNIKKEIEAINLVLGLRSELKSEPITTLEDVHTLRFENVTYYSGDERLENINFDIKRGEKLGVISIAGPGQDLMFNLFTKLIRPRDGVITINNCDINKINTFYLRDLITAVPQDDCLFSDTIINNITYPLPFDEYKYNDALHKSGLKETVSIFENKDQTIIDTFSDELLQRITLANAFYKDSKIFVFNEATSSLEVRDEDAIMGEIFKLKNKIVVLMTDKIYYIAKCDKVLILENEQVVEYGRTEELLQDRSSLYSKMVRKVRKVS